MFRPRFAWRSVAVLGAAALVLSACGEDGDDSGDNGGEPEGPLTIGMILPTTGGLAAYGTGMMEAVRTAGDEINEAGGVWGEDVEILHENEGPAEEPEVVANAADAIVTQGAHAVVGAASSQSSLQIMETLNGQQIIQVSPSNTGPDFTGHQHGEYYFRTAPSDIIQGGALAEEIIADGQETLGIIAQQTAYGEGLANEIAEVYEGAGGEVVYQELYDLSQTEYSAEIAGLVDEDPDAFVLVSYDESRQIIPSLVGAGFDPQDSQWYFVDGNRLDYSDFDEGLMEGVKASQPIGEEGQEDVVAAVEENYGEELPETAYVPESYDAAVLIALGAVAAGSEDPDAIREAMLGLTADGEPCDTFADCKELLENGEDIAYQGATGVVWNEEGDPAEATIGIFEYQEDNTFELSHTVVGEM